MSSTQLVSQYILCAFKYTTILINVYTTLYNQFSLGSYL